jgi:hypothetical protein
MLVPAFPDSLGTWDGDRLSKILRHVREGEALIRAGLHPTVEEANDVT